MAVKATTYLRTHLETQDFQATDPRSLSHPLRQSAAALRTPRMHRPQIRVWEHGDRQ